jgi:hypothetical protein
MISHVSDVAANRPVRVTRRAAVGRDAVIVANVRLVVAVVAVMTGVVAVITVVVARRMTGVVARRMPVAPSMTCIFEWS